MNAALRNSAADPAALEFAVMADRLTDAAIRKDLVQTLISTADLARMVRCLGPQQRDAALQARVLVEQAIEVLEGVLARSIASAARRDPRQAAYAATIGAV